MRIFAIGLMAVAIAGPVSPMAESAPAAAIRVAAFGAPLPRDPAPEPPPSPALPTAEQVTSILTGLTDPNIADPTRSDLVQGGTDSGERRAFRHSSLTKAAAHGELPLSFTVGNIWPVGPHTAAAQVTISGPKMPAPTIPVLTFVDQGGWKLSSDSAATLIQIVSRD